MAAAKTSANATATLQGNTKIISSTAVTQAQASQNASAKVTAEQASNLKSTANVASNTAANQASGAKTTSANVVADTKTRFTASGKQTAATTGDYNKAVVSATAQKEQSAKTYVKSTQAGSKGQLAGTVKSQANTSSHHVKVNASGNTSAATSATAGKKSADIKTTSSDKLTTGVAKQ